MKCKDCIHEKACAAWIRHGETLYDDFEYSVEDCPHYKTSHGQWVFGTVNHREYMKCSQCLHSYIPDGTFCYCPNCGAYMKGG